MLAIVPLAAPYVAAQSAVAGGWKMTFQTDQQIGAALNCTWSPA